MAEQQADQQLSGALARRARQQSRLASDRGGSRRQDKAAARPPLSALGQEVQSVTLRRAELVHGATTGASAEFKTRFPAWEDRVRGEQGTEVVIKAETVKKHLTFLNNYVTDLADMANQPDPTGTADNALEAFLQYDPAVMGTATSPGEAHSKQSRRLLVELLTDADTDENGKVIRRRVNEQKIKDFLLQRTEGNEQERHWALTTMLMEEDGIWTQAALGIDAIVRNHKFNKQRRDRLGGTRATIHDEVLTPRRLGRTALSTVTSAVAGMGWYLFARGRQEFKFKSDIDMLNQMKAYASPADRIYLRIKTGIDLDRIDNTGNYAEGYRPNLEAVYTKLDNVYSGRNEFLRQFGFDEPAGPLGGIDRSSRIGLPGEFIANLPWYNLTTRFRNPVDRRHPEGLPMRYSMEVMHEYGQIGNPDPTALTDEREINYVRLSKAYERVMLRYLQQDIALEQAAEHDRREAGALTALETKRRNMDDPTFREEQRTELITRRDNARTRRDEATERRRALREGEDSIAQRERVVRGIEDRLTSAEFGVILTGDINQAVEARIGVLLGEVNTAHGNLQTAVNNKRTESQDFVVNQVITPLRNAAQDVAQALRDAAAGGVTRLGDVNAAMPDVTALTNFATQSIGEQQDIIIAPLRQRYDELNTQLTQLREQYIVYQQAVNARERATETIANREPDQLQTALTAYELFVPTVPPGIIGPPPPPLGNVQALSAEALAELLTIAGTGGTPEENLRSAIQAKAWEEIQRTAAIPAYQEDAINVFGGLPIPISRDRILQMRPNELFTSLRDYYVSALGGGLTVAAAGDRARLETHAAYLGASNQLRALSDAVLTQDINHYDGIFRTAENQINALTNIDQPRGELDVAIAVMSGQGETFSRAYRLTDIPTTGVGSAEDELVRLGDINAVDPADTTLSQIERNSGLSRGVLEWYALIHPEYRNATNREQLFAALTRVLPPERLAEILDDQLNLGTGAFIDDVLYEINLRARGLGGRARFTGPQLQQATRRIINHVRDHGLAI